MHVLRACFTVVLVASLGACAGFAGGLEGSALTACPSAPHCVSSAAADEEHAIAPLKLAVAPGKAWAAALDVVRAMPRATIVQSTPTYLHAEIISPWHFYTDDLELLLRPELNRIEVRCSSRVGYYDFHVNRDRVESLRAELAKRGVVSN